VFSSRDGANGASVSAEAADAVNVAIAFMSVAEEVVGSVDGVVEAEDVVGGVLASTSVAGDGFWCFSRKSTGR
jgi:hypothetical protein